MSKIVLDVVLLLVTWLSTKHWPFSHLDKSDKESQAGLKLESSSRKSVKLNTGRSQKEETFSLEAGILKQNGRKQNEKKQKGRKQNRECT